MNRTPSASAAPYGAAVPWGTHFCQFYRTKEDLIEVLVPYFQAGLAANEQCVWITSERLPPNEARERLAAAVPDLDAASERGQIWILRHEEWYLRDHGSGANPLQGFLDLEQRAVSAGYSGVRVAGDVSWLDGVDWPMFAEYESKVTDAFRERRIIGLCSYCLDRCDSSQVIEVVRSHQCAVVRRGADWQIIENTTSTMPREQMEQQKAAIEERVAARTAELRAAVSARDEFLSLASHELKTPLTALQLYLDGLVRALHKRPVPPEEVGARLGKIREQCTRLDRLVSNLLDVSRASTKRLAISPEEVDLTELSLTVIARYREELDRAGCEVDFRTGGPVFGRWDRARLEQVLGNLLANAIKHAAGSPVRVSVIQDGELARLSVADHGPGIDGADRARIFDRFTSMPARYTGGFGLGLWIAKQIVQTHGGSISVASEPGRGATFTVVLPRVHCVEVAA